MDIKDYFTILWRRKWIVLLTTLAALVIAVVGTRMMTPVYQASTIVRVAASASGPLTTSGISYSNQLINTAAQIVSSRPMRDQVMSRLGLKQAPVVLASVIEGTELIKITVEYSNPQTAARVANTLADMLIAASNQLYTGGNVSSQEILAQQLADYKTDVDKTRQQYETLIALTPPAPDRAAVTLDILQLKERNYQTLLLQYNDAALQQQVRSSMMTVVESAVPPSAAIQPQPMYNYLLGFVLGLFVGIALAFIIEGFDPSIHSGKDAEKATGLPILAKLPKVAKSQVLMLPNDTTSLAEASRNLAANIILADQQHPEKVLLIMSGEPAQGKSTVTANLATALAEYGRNVVAVDCDMRHPRLHELFGLANDTGLGNILNGESDLKTVLRQAAGGLNVVTSGVLTSNPSQALGSPTMAKVVSGLRQQFDFVLLDTPALLGVSDIPAMMQNADLADSVDAFILVVRQEHAQLGPIQEAGAFIKKFGDKRSGLVLDEAGTPAAFSYYRTDKLPKKSAAASPAG